MEVRQISGVEDLPRDASFYIFGAGNGGKRLLRLLSRHDYVVEGFVDDVVHAAPVGYSLTRSSHLTRAFPDAHVLVPSDKFDTIAALFAQTSMTLYPMVEFIRGEKLSAMDLLDTQSPAHRDLQLLTRLISSIESWAPAPLEMPTELADGFTMGGRVPVQRLYRDDTILTVSGQGDETRIRLNLLSMVYPRQRVDELIELVRAGQCFYYGETDRWLYQALADHPVADQTVAVMGSGSPLYEAICLAHGASPLTVEYGIRISDDPRLRFCFPHEFEKRVEPVDAALSISAFEHDGLGRYGDPLDPDADLKTMASLTNRVKPAGLLYLSVPCQKDLLMWNVNRHYGSLRLPLLLRDWQLLNVYGAPDGLFLSFDPLRLDAGAWERYFDETGPNVAPEWVFVLRNDRPKS